jgi:hypothetical protein
MYEDSSLGFGRHLDHPNHGRSGQTGVGHKDQVDRPWLSAAVGALPQRNRLPCPNGVRSPNRDKPFDPDLAIGLSHRDQVRERHGRHEPDKFIAEAERGG